MLPMKAKRYGLEHRPQPFHFMEGVVERLHMLGAFRVHFDVHHTEVPFRGRTQAQAVLLFVRDMWLNLCSDGVHKALLVGTKELKQVRAWKGVRAFKCLGRWVLFHRLLSMRRQTPQSRLWSRYPTKVPEACLVRSLRVIRSGLL